MKKLALLMFTPLFFVLACSGGGGDKEPNNQISEASEASLTEPFDIKIDPEGDVDWFKIEIPEQGYLLVQSNNVPEGIGLQAKFALYQEWEGEKEKKLKDWTGVPAILHVPEAGTYYVALADDWNDAGSSDPISVKMKFVKEMDEFEMNDSHETAKSVELGKPVKLFIYPKGDMDWFKVNIEKSGYLEVLNRSTVEGVTPQVKFLKLDDESNSTKDLSDWNALPATCFVKEPGEVLILAHDDWDDKGANEAFEFKFEYLENMDLTEPNNTFKEASEVSRGDTITMAILPKGDNDFYKINIEEGNKIKFYGKNWEESITPQIKLCTLDTVAMELKDYADWKTLPIEFDVESGKSYYIQIHDDWDDKSSKVPFKIFIE